ncbi:hypothetical protein LCGC14_0782770, partial [marine sediment metagenome]
WVWHENVAATEKSLLKLLDAFGCLSHAAFRKRSLVVKTLDVAMEVVRGVPPAWGDNSVGIWRSASTADRRRAWRMAMKLLGYTEVCDE